MIQQKLTAIQERPEDISHGGFGVAGGAAVSDKFAEGRSFGIRRLAAEGSDEQCVEFLIIRHQGEIGNGTQGLTLIECRCVINEFAVHHRERLKDGRFLHQR